MARSTDIGNYFRVQADIRGLNYDKYFTEGENELTQIEDYHSHNVQQLDVNETVDLLLKLPFIQSVLQEWTHELTVAETNGSKSHFIQRAA
jgi:UDP-glucose 4-epimerase